MKKKLALDLLDRAMALHYLRDHLDGVATWMRGCVLSHTERAALEDQLDLGRRNVQFQLELIREEMR